MAYKNSNDNVNTNVENADSRKNGNTHVPSFPTQVSEFSGTKGMNYHSAELRTLPHYVITDNKKDCINESSRTHVRNNTEEPCSNVKTERRVSVIPQTMINNTLLENQRNARGYVPTSTSGSISQRNNSSNSHILSYQNRNGIFLQRTGTSNVGVDSQFINGTPRIVSNRSMNTQFSSTWNVRGRTQLPMVGHNNAPFLNSTHSVLYSSDVSKNNRQYGFPQEGSASRPSNPTKEGSMSQQTSSPNMEPQGSNIGITQGRHLTDMMNRSQQNENKTTRQGSTRTITSNTMLPPHGSNYAYIEKDSASVNEALSRQHPIFCPNLPKRIETLDSTQIEKGIPLYHKHFIHLTEQYKNIPWNVVNEQMNIKGAFPSDKNIRTHTNPTVGNMTKEEMLKNQVASFPPHFNMYSKRQGVPMTDSTKINNTMSVKVRTDDVTKNQNMQSHVLPSTVYPNYISNGYVSMNHKRSDTHVPLKKHHQLFHYNEGSVKDNSGSPLVFVNPLQKYNKMQSNFMQPRIPSHNTKILMNEIKRKEEFYAQLRGTPTYSRMVTPHGTSSVHSSTTLPVVNQRNESFMQKAPSFTMNHKPPCVSHQESSTSTYKEVHPRNAQEAERTSLNIENHSGMGIYQQNPLKREDPSSSSSHIINSLETSTTPRKLFENELNRTKQAPKKRNSMVLDPLEESLEEKKKREDVHTGIPTSLFDPVSTPRTIPVNTVQGSIHLFQNSKGNATDSMIVNHESLQANERKISVGMTMNQKKDGEKVSMLENKERKPKEKGSTTSSLSTYITLNDHMGLSTREKELCQSHMNRYLSYLPLVESTSIPRGFTTTTTSNNKQRVSQLQHILGSMSERNKTQLKKVPLNNTQIVQTNRGVFLQSKDHNKHMNTEPVAIPLRTYIKNISSDQKRVVPQFGMQSQRIMNHKMEPSKESDPKYYTCGVSAKKRVVSTASARGTYRTANAEELLTCRSIGYTSNVITGEKKPLKLPNEPSLRTVITPRQIEYALDHKEHSWVMPKEMQEHSKYVEKKAVVIGCNYPNMKKKRLYGAVNDAYAFSRTLVKYFGFTPENIVLLTDTFPSDSYICEEFDMKRKILQKEMEELRIPKKGNTNPTAEKSKRVALLNLFHGSNSQGKKGECLKNSVRSLDIEMEHNVDLSSNHIHPNLWPTRTNILKAVNWLVRDTRSHGSYVFYFAGKSVQVDNMSGWEGEGYDEAFLCSDPAHTIVEHNVLTAVQLKDLLLSINCLAQMTILLDCSGGQTILDPAGTDGSLTYIKGCKQKGIWPITNPTNKVHKAVYDTSILEHASMTKYFCQPRYESLTEVESTAAMIDPLLQSASSIPVTPATYCCCAATWAQTALEGLFPVVEFARVRQMERKGTEHSEGEQEKNKKEKKKQKKKGKIKSNTQKTLYEKKFDFSVNGMKSLFYKRKTKNTNPQICGVPHSEKDESCDDIKHKKKKEIDEQEQRNNKEDLISDANSSCSNSTSNEKEDNKNMPIVSHGIFTYCLIESIIEFKEQELKNNILEENNNHFLPMTLKNLIKVVQEKIHEMKAVKLKKLNQKPEVTLNPCANGSINSYFVQYSKNIDFQNLNFNYLKPDLSPFLNVQKAWEEVHKNTLRSQNHKASFNASLGLNSSMIPKPSDEVNSHRGVKNSYSLRY